MVQLHLNGKRKCDIIREYDISGALLDKWIKQSTTTGSFREKDNRSEMEQELIELRKRNKQLEMENDILKQAALIQKSKRHSWTKIAVIKNNVHKYSVSAMCSVLQISRSTYYYESKEKAVETKLTAEIKRIFRESRNNYGTRKIKKELDKLEWQNNHRIHSALGYQTPESIEKITLKKLSNKVLTIQYHSFVSNYFFN